MRELHSTYCLCGEPRNGLLSVPDVLLLYLSSVLRNDQTPPPECSPEAWQSLLRHLYPHWATPILYGYLRAWDEECLPPAEVMEMIRRDYLMGRVHSVQMDRQLGEILTAAEDHGIRMLILKGPALARSLYPDPAMRGGSDLDVLVCPEQVEEAESLLTALGYRCDENKFAVSSNYYHEETFYPDRIDPGHVAVEIHWRCTPSLGFVSPIPLEELFSRAVTVRTGHLTFETLAPRDAFLHTALHTVVGHTRSIRLIWIHDIALLAGRLRVPEDWAAVSEASRVWRARNAVEIALTMARIWTGFTPPPGYDDFTRWPTPSDEEEAIWPALLKKDDSVPSYLKLKVSALPDRREKIQMLRYLAGRHLRNWFR
ncbi:MAG: nucleotidyltransferase family protein [Methanofollis sp.]|nr:nucleotidyltransferase family protein [Methanofollis sp.]MDD4255297.1 nucleotidyltransferase family protein [Methanofollis sp.]